MHVQRLFKIKGYPELGDKFLQNNFERETVMYRLKII